VPSGDSRGQLYDSRSDKILTSLPSRAADIKRVVRERDVAEKATVPWDAPIIAAA
jgi:hypothetical protein